MNQGQASVISVKNTESQMICIETILKSHFSSLTDIWLVIDGKVYDFSRYAKVHPGGDRIFNEIIASGDPDVTERWFSSFEEGGEHPKWVKGQIRNRFVGNLEANSDQFKAEHERVEENGLQNKG